MSPADQLHVLAANPPGVVLLEQEGRIVAMDPAAEQMFGRPAAGWAGQPFESLLHRATAGLNPRVSGPATDTTGDPRTRHSTLGCQAQRADGSLFPLRYLMAHVAATEGTCFAVFVQDLGADEAAAGQSQMAERQLRALVELAPIAIWVTADDRVIRANRAAASLLGYGSASELIGQSVIELLTEHDRGEFRQHLALALEKQGEVCTLQTRLRRDGVEACEVEIAMAALPDHGQTTVQMVLSNVSQRNRELRELQRSRQLAKRLSANVVEALEEERRRIARELHDELGQSLSALKMDLVHCAQTQGLKPSVEAVSALMASIDSSIDSVRRIATNLRPPMLDDLGLHEALESLAGEFSKRSCIQSHLSVEGMETQLDAKVSIALYRMVQEALTNVARHSRATQVRIELHQVADEITLRVRDDGIGLPAPQFPQTDGQFGLLGIQERADALGGQLLLENPAEGGACLVVRLPVPTRVPLARAPRLIRAT